MMHPRSQLVVLALLGLAPACRSEQAKSCIAEYDRAQVVVRGVQSTSIESLEESLAALDRALAECKAAGRGHEQDELTKAKNQISAHLDLVRKKAARKQPPQSPEQIARLAKEGDPKCPKGQFYKHRVSGKDIRCTGPQMVDMTWSQAESYFRSRGYKVSSRANPPEVRAEYGAELYVFSFAKEQDASAPRCLTIHPAPEASWQEATARATGVQPSRLEANEPVRVAGREVPLKVEVAPGKQLIRLGSCGA